MDLIEKQNEELYHYGVIGMRWGIRKAKKQGTTYQYKSRAQRKYEKKLADQTSKKASENKLYKTQAKLNMYKHRDANREEYARRTSVGKSVAKGLLFGPFGTGNYNRLRAAGAGRVTSALASNWIAGTVGLPISMIVSKGIENRTATNQARIEERMNRSGRRK